MLHYRSGHPFENPTAAESTSTHGNEASFETVVEKNPEYIFVMDRDQAIGQYVNRRQKKLWKMNLLCRQMSTKTEKSSITASGQWTAKAESLHWM